MLALIYFTCFAFIAGSAFAMMWANINSISWEPKKPQHPEAPKPGEEVMGVDLSAYSHSQFQQTKAQLEDLYNE